MTSQIEIDKAINDEVYPESVKKSPYIATFYP